jgi:hypothetical protein
MFYHDGSELGVEHIEIEQLEFLETNQAMELLHATSTVLGPGRIEVVELLKEKWTLSGTGVPI